jgi:hypothetical protein
MACKFCLEDKKCIKAHIIPNSLYEPIFNVGKGMLILSNKLEIYPKKQHTGIYDENMVCEQCERLFSKLDDYANSFFSAMISEDSFIIENNEKVAYIIKNYDYNNLKLFLVSMLWRASISSQSSFFDVNIGPFENQIKEMIKNNDPGDENTFSFILTRYDNSLASRANLSPLRGKWYDSDINCYVFYLFGWKCFIKVDQRHPPEDMRFFMAKPHQPLIVLYLNFSKSDEIIDMKKMAILYKSRKKIIKREVNS